MISSYPWLSVLALLQLRGADVDHERFGASAHRRVEPSNHRCQRPAAPDCARKEDFEAAGSVDLRTAEHSRQLALRTVVCRVYNGQPV